MSMTDKMLTIAAAQARGALLSSNLVFSISRYLQEADILHINKSALLIKIFKSMSHITFFIRL